MGREVEAMPFLVRGMYFSGTGTTEKIVTAVAEVITRAEENFFRNPDIDFTPAMDMDYGEII